MSTNTSPNDPTWNAAITTSAVLTIIALLIWIPGAILAMLKLRRRKRVKHSTSPSSLLPMTIHSPRSLDSPFPTRQSRERKRTPRPRARPHTPSAGPANDDSSRDSGLCGSLLFCGVWAGMGAAVTGGRADALVEGGPFYLLNVNRAWVQIARR